MAGRTAYHKSVVSALTLYKAGVRLCGWTAFYEWKRYELI